MPEKQFIDLTDLGSEFVVHFGGELGEMNANTFAHSLLSICGIIEEVDFGIQSGFRVEVKIEALGKGSFRSKLKTVPTKIIETLNDKETYKHPMVVMVAALILSNYVFGADPEVSPKEKGDHIVLEENHYSIIVPQEAYDYSKSLKGNIKIDEHLRKTFEALEKDEAVTEFGLTKELDDKELKLKASRDDFSRLSSAPLELTQEDKRIVREHTFVRILKAVLEKGSRKWQFYWRDTKISASIKDKTFFEKLEARQISFTHGDSFEVILAIHQVLNKEKEVYQNEFYEIEEVIDSKPAPEQTTFLTD